MTAPVQKKFIEEFEEKEKKSHKGCFGFLKGRKVKIEQQQVYFSPLCRSEKTLQLNLLIDKGMVKYV